jgi:hypothetical protein
MVTETPAGSEKEKKNQPKKCEPKTKTGVT